MEMGVIFQIGGSIFIWAERGAQLGASAWMGGFKKVYEKGGVFSTSMPSH